MFGHNVVKNEYDHFVGMDPQLQHAYGTFLVPTTMQGMLLRPPSNTRDDGQPFSNQFMSTHDLGGYALLALSPAAAAVDPSLRPNSNIMSSPLAGRKSGTGKNGQLSSMGSVQLESMQSIKQQPGDPGPSASGTGAQSSTSTAALPFNRNQVYQVAHSQALTIREPRRTKRYQYWTDEEDELVRDLREIGGWTWKGISSELHRRLGGTHTWQAVQMRYLRTSKNRNSSALVPKLRAAKTQKKKNAAYKASSLTCTALTPVQPVSPVTVDTIQSAVEEDWRGRWLRISAKIGVDLDERSVREDYLQENQATSTGLQLYMCND